MGGRPCADVSTSARSSACGLMFQDSGSESTKAHFEPLWKNGATDAAKVNEEQRTRSPALTPSSSAAKYRAAVPDERAAAARTPQVSSAVDNLS